MSRKQAIQEFREVRSHEQKKRMIAGSKAGKRVHVETDYGLPCELTKLR